MLNETMLKLAEKGVVPPAEALGALAGNAPTALTASPSAAPFYEQAKQIRRRAAWSDLRKGVIMAASASRCHFFSMLDDGTPNRVGLVLLFVGIGYLRAVVVRGSAGRAAPAAAPPAHRPSTPAAAAGRAGRERADPRGPMAAAAVTDAAAHRARRRPR